MVIIFIRETKLPKSKPIKHDFIWTGIWLKQYMIISLNRITPNIEPKAIGNRNFKFDLTSLKKFKILSNSFSYNPVIIQITPLLIPGRIAAEPINIPFIKLTNVITL